ncbi:putative TBC1 domain family member 2A [Apostichopus japonicus]|uniref:Putative TBC1 domain family member 2A n=1 Tax=Stichopus japonicus TaxID=307972 RepID=A0A2G8JI46_STIJA|nr:putative TBC1 domain family member 2A [Apostichopus japonicus]
MLRQVNEKKVTTVSNPDDPVPWGDTGLFRRGSPTLRRKNHCGQDDHAADHITSGVTNSDVAPSPGTHGQSGRCSRLCRLHMRPLQLHLLKSADPTDPDMTTPIYRSEKITQHLRWWLDPDNWSQGVPFTIELPMTSVTTEASLTGWGAHWSNRTAWGTWSPTERSLHINILEMMAVKRALETFNRQVQYRQ